MEEKAWKPLQVAECLLLWWPAQDFLSPVREVLVTLTEQEFHISHRVVPRCWWLALWIAWEAAQLLLYYCSSPPVQPLPSSTQRSPGFLMAGFGAVSADSSDQGLLLQDCSPGWHLVSVVDFDGYTVQLTPASQKKKKKSWLCALLYALLCFLSAVTQLFCLNMNLLFSSLLKPYANLISFSPMFLHPSLWWSVLSVMEFSLLRHCARCGWWKSAPPTSDFVTIEQNRFCPWI